MRFILAALLAMLLPCALPAAAQAGDAPNTFKTVCSLVQTPAEPWAEDPISYPGVRPPVGPANEFFGNTGTDYNSTGQTLLADGAAQHTTCMDRFDTAAYWLPTLYRDGQRVEPSGIDAYYRRAYPLSDSKGNPLTQAMEPPTDFRMIAGDRGGATPQPMSVVKWRCIASVGGYTTPPKCPDKASGVLALMVSFPACWDGSMGLGADNTNDVAYFSTNAHSATCPSGHDVPIPRIAVTEHFDHPTLPDCRQVDAPDDGANCYVYTISEYDPTTGRRDDQGSVFGENAAFLNGWSDGPDSVDPSPLDFGSLIGSVDNAPDGSPGCLEACTRTDPPGDAFVPIY